MDNSNKRQIIVSNSSKGLKRKSYSEMNLKTRLDAGVGVYSIVCSETNSAYIGQSKNITGRLKNHKSLLKSGKHPIERMQSDYNLFGDQSFAFEKIYECSEEHTLQWETSFIKEYIANGFDMYNTVTETHNGVLLQVSKEQKRLFEKIMKAMNDGKLSIEQLEQGIDSLLYS